MKNLFVFINKAYDTCENTLIHSVHGTDRSLFVASVYLMVKFHWKASDAIEVVSSCRHIRMNPQFEKSLSQFEQYLPPLILTPDLINEEITLRNTYFNKELRLKVSP